jgi:hypothetical protein
MAIDINGHGSFTWLNGPYRVDAWDRVNHLTRFRRDRGLKSAQSVEWEWPRGELVSLKFSLLSSPIFAVIGP